MKTDDFANQFVRLFNEGVHLGERAEQERIIKLLEENLAFDLDIGIFDLESNCQLQLNHLIALIKGEQK